MLTAWPPALGAWVLAAIALAAEVGLAAAVDVDFCSTEAVDAMLIADALDDAAVGAAVSDTPVLPQAARSALLPALAPKTTIARRTLRLDISATEVTLLPPFSHAAIIQYCI